MQINPVIVSLRFNPGFIQTLIAFAKASAALNLKAEFLVDPAYTAFPELVEVANCIEFCELPLAHSWSHAILVNASLQNRELATELKRQGTRVLYVYHEPWHMSLSYLREEGPLATLRALAAHRASVPLLRLADQILLPSRTALKIYSSSDARNNPNAVFFPLIFEDEAPQSLSQLISEKKFFSFIGKPCRSHGFDQFVRTMRVALEKEPDARFLIASRFPLPAFTLKDPLIQSRREQIEARCGRALSSDEMNRCYLESYCIWNVYRRSTQSGVLPKAFMFGSPVVASKVGSFPEFVEDGINGRFADAEDPEGIWTAVRDMRLNIGKYAASCRETFCKTFHYEPWLAELSRMLQGG